jgi:hypothetical protein
MRPTVKSVGYSHLENLALRFLNFDLLIQNLNNHENQTANPPVNSTLSGSHSAAAGPVPTG